MAQPSTVAHAGDGCPSQSLATVAAGLLQVPPSGSQLQVPQVAGLRKGSHSKVDRWLSSARTCVTLTENKEGDQTMALLAPLSAPPERRADAKLKGIIEWWQKYLPYSGGVLAPELRVPDKVMLEVFRQSRITIYDKGRHIQEEGEEVRGYAIILTGKCKVRCSRPSAHSTQQRPRKASASDTSACQRSQLLHASTSDALDVHGADDELVASGALDSDGFIPIREAQGGDSIGMYPGDHHASYEVVCSEKAAVLLLYKEEYDAILKPFQKEVHAQVVDFLHQHRLCPEAAPASLERLARYFKHKKVSRGRTIVRAGSPHRHVWFLREGSCTVFMGSEDATEITKRSRMEMLAAGVEVDDQDTDTDFEAEDAVRLAQLKSVGFELGGNEQMRRGFVDTERDKSVAKYAHGKIRKSLAGGVGLESSDDVDRRGRSNAAAVLSNPGAIFGDEVLVLEPKDVAAAKYQYTLRTDTDCSFFVADVTTWRSLAMCVAPEVIAQGVHGQLQRRSKTLSCRDAAMTELERRKLRLQRAEISKGRRQQVSFPERAGDSGPTELKNIDDFKKVVFDHRRGPLNETDLPTLAALEGTKLGPRCPNNGPAVNCMLQYVTVNPANTMSAKAYCANLRQIRSRARRSVRSDKFCNPLGEYVSKEALMYYEAADPQQLLPVPSHHDLTAAGELSRISSQPSFVDVTWHAGSDTEATIQHSSSTPVLVSSKMLLEPLDHDSAASNSDPRAKQDEVLSQCEDVALRPVSQASQRQGKPSGFTLANDDLFNDRPSSILGASDSVGCVMTAAGDGPATALPQGKQRKRPPGAEKQTKMRKAFARAVSGKSFLVLTDKMDVRKAVTRSFVAAEVDVCFVKSSNDTWHQLGNPKASFHAMIWDLSKNDVDACRLLQQIRQHGRYRRLPIIVLSAEEEVPEEVSLACSFVVFHPVAPSMLREALIWCLDRRAFADLGRQEIATSTAWSS